MAWRSGCIHPELTKSVMRSLAILSTDNEHENFPPVCGPMTVAASIREKAVGLVMVAAAIVYLISFVPRGWIPHDEGMLGQSAERVLHGGLPHVDYEEMYTGGLSWLYAGVFRVAGVDLLNLRWALFVGASLAICLVYAITRRYLRPASAGLATWVALVWS